MKEKKEFVLTGLACANCAAKIEEQLNRLPGVSGAVVDFGSSILVMEIQNNKINDLKAQVQQIVKKIEPQVVVKEREEAEASKDEGNPFPWRRLVPGIISFTFVIAFELPDQLELLLYLVSYFLIGGPVIWQALRNIFRGQVFDENFLMTIATIGAFTIGEYSEAVAVMLFYAVGEGLQDLAVDHSRRSIKSLLVLRPDYVNLVQGEEVLQVEPEEVAIGDLFLVKPGERVPLDGIVREGESQVDTSTLTGESRPYTVNSGSEILSGSINTTGLLTIEATREYSQSTVAKIMDLVQSASARKAPTEKFITKFAKFYTPVVVAIAALVAVLPPLITGAPFDLWLYRALIFLVISCPCALVISIPLSFFAGIGAASKQGILVKGGNYLEALNQVSCVVFDKTGTLTKGSFEVIAVMPSPESKVGPEELLHTAAQAEYYSTHPIGLSILLAAGEIEAEEIKSYQEVAGKGVSVQIAREEILAGNERFLAEKGINCSTPGEYGTVVHVARAGQYLGYLVISDEIKKDSLTTIRGLKGLGVKRTVILSGDNRATAQRVAEELEIAQVFAELLPQDKLAKIEELSQELPGKVAYMGDGINDAPVLAGADLGIAMGGLGSDAAIEAADIVLTTDEPSRIITAIHIARQTHSIVWQNIFLALGVKVIVLILGISGLTSMWAAVFADVGVALLAVMNSLRILRVK
ncbi:MAG: heavy metal translocating P-type ATPase [Peptococcia bacterium]